jgi:hypothetical protein
VKLLKEEIVTMDILRRQGEPIKPSLNASASPKELFGIT